MKIKQFIPIVVAAFLFVFGSCERKVEVPTFGCTDINSPRANLQADFHDSTCVYMYATEFEISYFENKAWDSGILGFERADIKLKLSTIDSVHFESFQVNNAEPNEIHRWVSHDQLKLLNKPYTWELYNGVGFLSVGETEELMTSGILNPLDFKNDSVIVMTDATQTTQIKIRYEIK